MKTPLFSYYTLFVLIAIGAKGQTIQEFKTTPKSVIGYIEYIPPDYHSNSFDYPVMIFLHGLGQRGPNSTDPEVLESAYYNLVAYGPPRHVKQGTQFPFLLISPQLKNNYGDWPAWYIMEVIEHVRTYLRIDPKRIYLTGSSLGGGGTWTAAQDFPDYFGAIAPVAGSRNSPSKACAIAGSNLPVWAFHGDKDSVVPLSRSVNMVNAINACKPSIPAKLTIYEGLGHNAHAYAYDLTEKYQSPTLYEWILSWDRDLANKMPKANAGPDLTVSVSDNNVTLSGSGSDPDGSISNYSWSKLKGGEVSFSGRTTSKVTLSNLVVGTYVFRLTVRDNKGAITSDDVTVVVQSGGNISPVANAGPDKTITLPVNTVTITGSGSDSDGSITSYAWTKVSGGNATLSGASTSTLTASNLVAGTYTFRLTVKDNGGLSKSDDVKVIVNVPPTVNAGQDLTIELPDNTTTIKATASDPDGTIASYAWSKVSGPAATLSGISSATLTAGNLVSGTYIFRITVKDNHGAAKSDDITVTVLDEQVSNTPPVADAGPDKIISLPDNAITLTGTGTDKDGTISAYTWTKISGGSASLSGASSSKLTASGLVAGTYVFRLTVTDNNGASKSDDVKVIVNAPPVANAGPDKTISLPANALTLTGNAADTDGAIVSYRWEKSAGGNAILTGANTISLQLSSLAAGEYQFRLTVTDNHGATHSDYVRVLVNVPPVADAGSDQTTTLTNNMVTLTGKGSDKDGTIVSYAWKKISGGAASLAGASSPTLKATGLEEGTYEFSLTVKDNHGATHSDKVSVLVKANKAPVAQAGPDKIITLPENAIIIQGAGSDPDGSIVSYKWKKVSGGNASLNGVSSATLKATNLKAGSYEFSLTVTDNLGASHTDHVRVTVNVAPVANAGPDKLINIPQNAVSISGSGSDKDGKIASYEWQKISGGNATLSGKTSSTLVVKNMAAGIYEFRLTVTDDVGAIASDLVKIIVNKPPVVLAGPDRTITLPTNSVAIKGSGKDEDGMISSWLWNKVSGPTATMRGKYSAALNLSGLVEGSYVFRLTATDNHGAASSDDVMIVVKPEPENVLPVADAGVDKIVILPENSIMLTGSGIDVDGSVTAYAWEKLTGGPAMLENSTSSSVTVSNLEEGIYVFRFSVKDNRNGVHSDDVMVSVFAPTGAVRNEPIAYAGEDLVVTLPAKTTTVNGWGATPSGRIISYQWEQVSGTSVKLVDANTPAMTIADVSAPGKKVFRLTVKNSFNFTASSEVSVEFVHPGPLKLPDLGPSTEDSVLPDEDEVITLDPDNMIVCSNCEYLIWNDVLQRLHSGPWKEDSYQRVFTRAGMYYYNIRRDGKLIKQGKIFRRVQ